MLVSLILKEIKYRWLNFFLALSAVVAAVTVFVTLLTMGRALEDETRRLMRDMGFNLLIVPKGTDMGDFWAQDFAAEEMPEEYVHRLAASEVAADHYVAMLRRKIRWQGRQILLTGVLPELGAIGKRKKSPMGFNIPRGSAYVGFELARAFNLKAGDTIEVLGQRLTVKHCLQESGSKEDISLYAHLHDVQEMLGKRGKINLIQALGCLCYGAKLSVLRQQLAEALPETKVTEIRSIATARAEQRGVVEKYVAVILPVVLVICAAWVGILSLMNVHERRQEIGILRALGLGSARIAFLFLGKALLIGLVGAGIGFVIGTELALQFGADIFKITFAKIKPSYALLAWSLMVAPGVTALASFFPTMVAVTQDPAVILTQE